MQQFVLSQAELVVLAKMLLGLPLPPLGMPADPALAERSLKDVTVETLARLMVKGWVQEEKEGGLKVHPELAALLRTAGYLEAWMTILFHERDQDMPQEVGFYYDGERVVQHELNPQNHTHIFRPGPADMGYAWAWERMERFVAPDSPDVPRQVLSFPAEIWETLLKARLVKADVAAAENLTELSPQTRELANDIVAATLLVQMNCLCNVYTGEQEEATFLLGPERNWMFVVAPCHEDDQGKNCLQARVMTRAALQRTLSHLWRSINPQPVGVRRTEPAGEG